MHIGTVKNSFVCSRAPASPGDSKESAGRGRGTLDDHGLCGNLVRIMSSLSQLLKQHRSLLADELRLSAFAAAIGRSVRPDDVVLDLGSGSGILAMLAARAGARRVFAIEREHIVDVAAMLARQNDVAVEWFHRSSAEVELPERATLLITETLGNLGFDEGILGSVIDARRRLLAPDARIVPQSIELIAAPVEAAALHSKRVGWWGGSRQGFDLTAVRTFASNQVWIAEFDPDQLLAPAAVICEKSLARIDSTTVAGSATFTVTREGALHGFGGWFSARLTREVTLSNAPPLQTPNWSHGFLPLEEPLPVRAGSTVRLELQSDNGESWRWRGTVDGIAFDQMTQFGFAPCVRG